MRSITWMASGAAPRLGLWLGLFALCAAASAQQQQPADQQAPPQQPVKLPTDPENIESMFSVSLYYWSVAHQTLGIRGGMANPNPPDAYLNYPTARPRVPGFTITFPTGGFNRMEFSYFSASGSPSITAPSGGAILGANITAGEQLDLSYKVTNVRVAWNYLTFPVPPIDSRLRIKTFWEVSGTSVKPVINFPSQADPNTGVIPRVSPARKIIYPGFGIGVEYVRSQNLRFESRISGMALPGRSRYVDAEATVVGRLGSIELFGGIKLFNFRTTLKGEDYTQGTLWGPLFGLRYVFPRH